jgi:protoheme IX farnesyltransferase
MKFWPATSFSRLALVLLASVLLLTIAGTVVGRVGADAACGPWSACSRFGWPWVLQVIHVVLAIWAGLIMTWLLIRAWNEERSNNVVLPLATVTAVLFFGQAFVGAMQVLRGFPAHLVVLHTLTAISLWISLLALVVISGRQAAPSAAAGTRRGIGDFIALTKPWIVALLLVTTLGGLIAGGRAWPSPALAFWTLLGGALAAGGSSALNQYIDRELDKNMQRTARRPLPAGRLSPAEGLSWGLALCLISYYLVACLVNFTAALLCLAGIFYYVIFYSVLLKRLTVQNIVIGGGAGAIPPMVGWAAATGHLSITAWILFLIIFMWTPPHFWALAIVRTKDYAQAGIPMLPVVKGERATRRQILVYTILLVATTLLLPIVGSTGRIYAIAALVLGILLLVAAWRLWRIPGNKVAWTMYRWSSLYLLFIFVALAADALS